MRALRKIQVERRSYPGTVSSLVGETVLISLAAAPWDHVPDEPAVLAPVASAPKRCTKPGCGRVLADINTTTLCTLHVHDVRLCQCKGCKRKRGMKA